MKISRIILLLLFVCILGFYIFLKNQNGFIFSNISYIESNASLATKTNPNTAKYVSPISIEYLRSLKIEGSDLKIEQTLSDGYNYKKYIASYLSEGFKIYGLLTVPKADMPQGGFSAIILNHGYIPPTQYVTTEKYVAYVDYLARNEFVVFKIDMRGHGKSEGLATGSYFSNGYTIDVISALKSLQKDTRINPQKIGLWGHSMSGNLILRSMLVNEDIKAGVIWAGAVYSYEDFAKYGISDNSYMRRSQMTQQVEESPNRERSAEVQNLRERSQEIDFTTEFWKSISLTQNLKYLNAPIQLHHPINDDVVNIGYSRDLKTSIENAGKQVELFEYKGGGHNIDSPYFEQAMQRTVEFFKSNL